MTKYPLSLIQETMWQQALAWPHLTQGMVLTVQLTGELDVRILKQCLNAIVSRHEILRTTFSSLDGLPFQIVHSRRDVILEIEDLSRIARGKAFDEFRRKGRDVNNTPFDLNAGPLLRPILYTFNPKNHLLLIVMHHIIADLWSSRVLLGELSMLYMAYSNGNDAVLKDTPTQYHQYTLWQRQRLQGNHLQKLLAFWQKHLKGIEKSAKGQVTSITTGTNIRKEIHSVSFRGDAIGMLRALSQSEHVTRFMVMLLTLAVAVHKRTKRPEFVVLATVANRGMPLSNNLMGPCANTIVLRIDLSGNPTLRELLRRIRGVTLAALANSELPLPMLIEHMLPLNTEDAVCVCDASINMVRRSGYVRLPLLTMRQVQIGYREPVSRRYLHLKVIDDDHQTVISLSCDSDILNKQEMRRLGTDMKSALTKAFGDPTGTLSGSC